jgi:hypothetical protein
MADLRMTRVSLINNTADGARVTGGRLTCTRCTIAQNTNRGINAFAGAITISQSAIVNNLGGGILIGSDAGFQIVGNVFFNNGTPASTTGAINIPQVMGSSANRLDFNSISRNNATAQVAPGVACVSLVTQLTARYNIIWDNGTPPVFQDQINSGGCEHALSVIGPVPAAFGTNINTDPGFTDELAGDLHLKQSDVRLHVNVSAGELAGPAARDIDDEPRGMPADMGADQVSR